MDADRVPLLLAFEASEVRRTSSGDPADPSDLLLLEDDDEADIVASPLHPDFNLDNLGTTAAQSEGHQG